MRRQDSHQQVCSIARTMAVIGDSWTMLILRDCFFGLRRFSDIQKSLGINRNRLSERLNLLVEHEILSKELYDESRQRFEYRLSEKGLDLYPVLMAIVGFGDKHMSDADGPPLLYHHKSCGHKAMQPVFSCDQCRAPLDAREVEVAPGPGILKKLMRGEDTGFDIEHMKKNFRAGES